MHTNSWYITATVPRMNSLPRHVFRQDPPTSNVDSPKSMLWADKQEGNFESGPA